ncbi:hypothetical protein [uncultured Dubosiella sp.]|uniref:hypothetical protein n=1 Tax=uncultured Dubosiella sp. TaxID=1937011 RepID=UPI0025B4658F|nr:hypothetical protein [uncultured Dubosiella sp.]
MNKKWIKILIIVLIAVLGLVIIYFLTNGQFSPNQETRSAQEQNEQLGNTLKSSTPEEDTKEMNEFKSTVDQIEGTVGY